MSIFSGSAGKENLSETSLQSQERVPRCLKHFLPFHSTADQAQCKLRRVTMTQYFLKFHFEIYVFNIIIYIEGIVIIFSFIQLNKLCWCKSRLSAFRRDVIHRQSIKKIVCGITDVCEASRGILSVLNLLQISVVFG